MSSYLKNRYQRVVIKDSILNKSTSEWEPVKRGVPQGSILGPLLFLIYINDFSLTLNKIASPILFADDTSIVISNSNLDEFKNNMNLAMNETVVWFQNNFLTPNCNKTYFLQFLTKKRNAMPSAARSPASYYVSLYFVNVFKRNLAFILFNLNFFANRMCSVFMEQLKAYPIKNYVNSR